MKNKRLLGFFTSLILFSGCASAELELTVDIYNKDIVSENQWTEEHLKYLERARDAANKLASERSKQAQSFVELLKEYEIFYNSINGLESSEESSTLKIFRNQLAKYKEAIKQKKMEVHALINQSAINLNTLAQSKGSNLSSTALGTKASRINIFLISEEIRSALTELGTINLDTDFENNENIIKQYKAYLNDESLKAKIKISKVPEKNKKVRTLVQKTQEFAKQQENLNEKAKQQIEKLEALDPQNDVGTAITEASGIAVQTWAEISKNRGLNSQAKLAISGLAQGIDFKNSQIDRIQDSADPAWRDIISKPGTNDDKNWSPLFARTYFRAEGNNSVVIARERPGHYRMKRGSNDPAALIKGQLRINRAIASGLIDVVGAYTGISGASGILPDAPKGSKAPSGEEVTISKKEAQLNAKAKFRKSARKALKKRIIQMRDSVKKEAETDNGSLKPLIKPINPGTYHNIHSMIDGFQVTFDRISED